MRKLNSIIIILFFTTLKSVAQDGDLLKMLEDSSKTVHTKDYATAAFKTSRLINGHSIENAASGVLDVKISHRFGFVNTGAYEFFGLDQATMRMGFDYGINDRLMVGIGRSTYQKQYDAFYKYKILRQAKEGSYISLSITSSIQLKSIKWEDPNRLNYASSRFSFSNQLLIVRKFSESISLQLMPSHVHYNLVKTVAEPNDIFALGMGGRIKLNKRISFNIEYYPLLPLANEKKDYRLNGTHNSLALGFDIETGGHVFQLHFTNSTGMSEGSFIGETVGDFFKGDIHFGFNISRVFTISNKKRK